MSNFRHTAESQWRRRTLRGLAAGLVVLGLGLAPAGAQDSIDDARELRDMAREQALEAQAALDVLDGEYSDVKEAFQAADELVLRAEARAESIGRQLELAELRLARAEVGQAWVDHDQAQLDDQLRTIAIQQYLGTADESNLLVEDDPTEALVRDTLLGAVNGANDDLFDRALAAESRQEQLREQAKAGIAEVAALTERLDSELADLEAAREVRERALDLLNGRRQEWIDRIDDIDAEEARLTDFIRGEQQRIDIQSALDAAQSSEGYVWPTTGGIGSYFGPRVHPILGYSRLHGGLDIGGKMGQPIWAAKEGLVILAGVKGGYGNTIVIDHGNGYATLYGHQSSFEVSQGDRVETGQHIGNVGSTGLSTGPHLHFEIRIDGGVVDPLPYLPAR